VRVDLFAEDKAHEATIEAIVRRVAREIGVSLRFSTKSAIGGHPRAFGEPALYQKALASRGLDMPDILVVCIDANCKGYNDARRNITDKLSAALAAKTVPAAPDPHIERWLFADLDGFHRVVGNRPSIARRKCDRAYYKNACR
jgi:hypothetical protein